MELGQLLVHTNLENQSKNSQQTRFYFLHTIQRVSSVGGFSESLKMKVFQHFSMCNYMTPSLFYGGKQTGLQNVQQFQLLQTPPVEMVQLCFAIILAQIWWPWVTSTIQLKLKVSVCVSVICSRFSCSIVVKLTVVAGSTEDKVIAGLTSLVWRFTESYPSISSFSLYYDNYLNGHENHLG